MSSFYTLIVIKIYYSTSTSLDNYSQSILQYKHSYLVSQLNYCLDSTSNAVTGMMTDTDYSTKQIQNIDSILESYFIPTSTSTLTLIYLLLPFISNIESYLKHILDNDVPMHTIYKHMFSIEIIKYLLHSLQYTSLHFTTTQIIIFIKQCLLSIDVLRSNLLTSVLIGILCVTIDTLLIGYPLSQQSLKRYLYISSTLNHIKDINEPDIQDTTKSSVSLLMCFISAVDYFNKDYKILISQRVNNAYELTKCNTHLKPMYIESPIYYNKSDQYINTMSLKLSDIGKYSNKNNVL